MHPKWNLNVTSKPHKVFSKNLKSNEGNFEI